MKKLLEEFSGRTGLVFTDINKEEYVSIDTESEYPTASVIKIYILGALLKKCETGESNLGEIVEVHNNENVEGTGVLKIMSDGIKVKLIDLAALMIDVSDNVATNLLIDYLGGIDTINKFIRSCGLIKTTLNRKVSRNKESKLLGISTAGETAEYLYKMIRGQIVGSQYVEIYKRIMKQQQINNSFVRKLENMDIAHKTGSFEGARNDVGYVFTKENTYIFVAFTDGSDDWGYYCDSESYVYLGRLGEYCYKKYVKMRKGDKRNGI